MTFRVETTGANVSVQVLARPHVGLALVPPDTNLVGAFKRRHIVGINL